MMNENAFVHALTDPSISLFPTSISIHHLDLDKDDLSHSYVFILWRRARDEITYTNGKLGFDSEILVPRWNR